MKQSLLETHPQLAAEWSDRNLPLSPSQITFGSNRRVWWQGRCGHEWETTVKARSQGENCPYCAGKRVLIGWNDLQTVSPALAAEWSEKNEGISPQSVTAGSHKKVWWKGACGHEWQAVVKNRVRGAGCPYCSSRRVLPGQNDLAATRPALAAEWSKRNHPLQPTGVTAFSNRTVWWTCRTCGHEWKARIADRSAGSSCPYCSGRRFVEGFHDLASTHPAIAAEWSKRNRPLMAAQVNQYSRKQVWWECRTCGHEWKAVIHSRVRGRSCPVCAGRMVLPGRNDLATTDPALCEEWDYARNGALRPSVVLRTSRRAVWWRGRCGHGWRDTIENRTVWGQGCRICQRDFARLLPALLILYYAWLQGVEVVTGDSGQIGLPLDFYFPQLTGAIQFSRGDFRSRDDERQEQVTDYLCCRRQIRLIRIISKGEKAVRSCDSICLQEESALALSKAIREAFHRLGMHVEVQPAQEQEILRECYRRWKENRELTQ